MLSKMHSIFVPSFEFLLREKKKCKQTTVKNEINKFKKKENTFLVCLFGIYTYLVEKYKIKDKARYTIEEHINIISLLFFLFLLPSPLSHCSSQHPIPDNSTSRILCSFRTLHRRQIIRQQ